MEDDVKEKSTSINKKKRNQSEWKREKRKRSIIAGESHISVKGEIISRKEIGPGCNCKLKCYDKVDSKTRKMLFDGFYALKSYDEQNAYLFGLIRKYDLKRKKNIESDRRTCTYKYYVRNRGQEIQVCKLAFAHIHAVSFRKIRTLSEKLDQNILFPRDGRGKHNNRPKKIPEETFRIIKNHIDSILKSNELKNFIKDDKTKLIPELNVAKLYTHFLQTHEKECIDLTTGLPNLEYTPKVKCWLYRKVFHDEMKSKDVKYIKRFVGILCDDKDNSSNKNNSPSNSSKEKEIKKSRRKGVAKKVIFNNESEKCDGEISGPKSNFEINPNDSYTNSRIVSPAVNKHEVNNKPPTSSQNLLQTSGFQHLVQTDSSIHKFLGFDNHSCLPNKSKEQLSNEFYILGLPTEVNQGMSDHSSFSVINQEISHRPKPSLNQVNSGTSISMYINHPQKESMHHGTVSSISNLTRYYP